MRAIDSDTLRQRCLALVEEHYRDAHVSPTWLARTLYVSRRQLDRAFVEGASVAEILARRRLRQVLVVAALNVPVPMSDIVTSCGYSTYETFRAQCHRYLKRSPRAARAHFTSVLRISPAPTQAA
ncbi:helix-turn-helix domain-containing protein [Microbacterium esteraromaticum]|uniref:helix-turn-helix domain-containing protein n=1 Tax=Microbacterium esteraromaticum TaxID=57043 RepID=UPI003CC7FBE9